VEHTGACAIFVCAPQGPDSASLDVIAHWGPDDADAANFVGAVGDVSVGTLDEGTLKRGWRSVVREGDLSLQSHLPDESLAPGASVTVVVASVTLSDDPGNGCGGTVTGTLESDVVEVTAGGTPRRAHYVFDMP